MAHPQIIMKDEEPTPIVNAPLDLIDPYAMQTVGISHQGDNTIYHYRQEVSGILNNNERERMDGVNDGSKEFRKAASIPFVVWNLWESMGITLNQKELRKAIERHKNEYKTTEKRLI